MYTFVAHTSCLCALCPSLKAVAGPATECATGGGYKTKNKDKLLHEQRPQPGHHERRPFCSTTTQCNAMIRIWFIVLMAPARRSLSFSPHAVRGPRWGFSYIYALAFRVTTTSVHPHLAGRGRKANRALRSREISVGITASGPVVCAKFNWTCMLSSQRTFMLDIILSSECYGDNGVDALE